MSSAPLAVLHYQGTSAISLRRSKWSSSNDVCAWSLTSKARSLQQLPCQAVLSVSTCQELYYRSAPIKSCTIRQHLSRAVLSVSTYQELYYPSAPIKSCTYPSVTVPPIAVPFGSKPISYQSVPSVSTYAWRL